MRTRRIVFEPTGAEMVISNIRAMAWLRLGLVTYPEPGADHFVWVIPGNSIDPEVVGAARQQFESYAVTYHLAVSA